MKRPNRDSPDRSAAATPPRRRAASVFVFGSSVALIVAIAAVAAAGPTGGSPAAHRSRPGGSDHGSRLSSAQKNRLKRKVAAAAPDIDPADMGVPSVSTATADTQVPFALLVPNSQGVSRQDLTGTYVLGDNAVQMDFPPLGKPADDVRQPDITIWEAPWTEGDPLTAYKQDVANDPDPNKSICSVGNLPALCVAAKSPNDATQENPAFVRIVIKGTEVELSGGDSLSPLLDAAASLQPAAAAAHDSQQN